MHCNVFFIFTIVRNIFSDHLFTIHYTFPSKIITHLEILPFALIIFSNHNNIKISGQEKPSPLLALADPSERTVIEYSGRSLTVL